MALDVDPDLLQAAVALAVSGALPSFEPAARHDWSALRANGEASLAAMEATLPDPAEVERTDSQARSADGADVRLRWYCASSRPPAGAPAVVYLHGGGMILGSVELYDRTVARYVADSGVSMVSVDYRRAPEHPHPAPVEDCFAGLQWLVDHADELGIDPRRIGLMGDSAGGGLAAGTAQLARDRGVAVARQILVYPMLDDRTTIPNPALAPFAAWSYDDNYTGWHALLGDAVGGPDVSTYAAPAREGDLTGLPPTYLEVGDLDIFCDETIEYGQRLARAGTPVELHVHSGCFHGFDRLGWDVPVVRRAMADRIRVLQRL